METKMMLIVDALAKCIAVGENRYTYIDLKALFTREVFSTICQSFRHGYRMEIWNKLAGKTSSQAKKLGAKLVHIMYGTGET
jgi:hypothetical protein